MVFQEDLGILPDSPFPADDLRVFNPYYGPTFTPGGGGGELPHKMDVGCLWEILKRTPKILFCGRG